MDVLTSSSSVSVAVLAAKANTVIVAVSAMNRGIRLSLKRATVLVALFLWLLFGIGISDARGECRVSAYDLTARVSKVVDGDTLHLDDGRKVRLIGINTPEIGREGVPSEPFAQQARSRLIELLGDQSMVRLKIGRDARDRYGRLLAHAFTVGGESIEERLIEEGLGMAVAIPPNLLLQSCLFQVQSQVRGARIGVWQDSYFSPRPSVSLVTSDTGFRLVSGVVERVSLKKGGSWWVLLEGRLALLVAKSSQPYFNEQQLQGLVGRQVVVSGWLVKRRLNAKEKAKGYKPFLMSIKHPASFLEPVKK